MKTNFERVKMILDKLDKEAVEAAGGSVDHLVKRSLNDLTVAYQRLLNANREPVDYSSVATHLAYAFRCMAPHADCLYRTLAEGEKHVVKALGADTVHVGCLGGGPGSEILGTMKFAERAGLSNKKFHFTTVDREKAWLPLRRATLKNFPHLALKSEFVQYDMSRGAPSVEAWKFAANVDIYTLSFALSEVWCFNGQGRVSTFVQHVFNNAKKGSIFAYVDNGGPNFLSKFETELIKRNDLMELVSCDDGHVLIGNDEQQSAIGPYVTRYGQNAKLTGDVKRRLWIKT